jgi:hypothetical protein
VSNNTLLVLVAVVGAVVSVFSLINTILQLANTLLNFEHGKKLDKIEHQTNSMNAALVNANVVATEAAESAHKDVSDLAHQMLDQGMQAGATEGPKEEANP